MKKIISIIKHNALLLLILIFACVTLSVFAWRGSDRSSHAWKINASIATSTRVPTDPTGWWTTPTH
jgi:hypothetical protein